MTTATHTTSTSPTPIRSEYQVGEYLVTPNGFVFVHDGYIYPDGYGCLIGMTDPTIDHTGLILKSPGSGKWLKHSVDHIASEAERQLLNDMIMRQDKIIPF